MLKIECYCFLVECYMFLVFYGKSEFEFVV